MAGAALAGCRDEPRRPSVLLVSIDALRADRLTVYGYPRPTSPFLAELGASGTVFANAFVNTHGTTTSHTTMLSGLYQGTHGVGMESSSDVVRSPIPAAVPLVQELLRAAGYATIGITDGGNVGKKFGFARGFEVFDDRGGGIRWTGPRLERALAEARSQRPAAPVFAFFHTYAVHSPYDPAPEYRRLLGIPDSVEPATTRLLRDHVQDAERLGGDRLAAISALYDAEIRQADDELRALFARLRSSGVLDNCLVIVTSDHGEEFGEHGGLLHRGLLYEELLRVPLLVAGDGGPGGRRETRLVSTVDIVPSILGHVGVPLPRGLPGRSFLAPARGGGEERVFAQYGGSRFAVRTPAWKLIASQSGKLELYDLASDPGERENLAEVREEVRDRLRGALEEWRSRQRPVAQSGPELAFEAEEIERLRALGYLGGQ
jgi:arylsulfatase A-like enzyme